MFASPRSLLTANQLRVAEKHRAQLSRKPCSRVIQAFRVPTFVDGEAPGSGKRNLPSSLNQAISNNRTPGPADKFDMIPTAEMYRKFPVWVHSGPPPSIEDKEPAGLSALRTPDSGPQSGKRMRPSPYLNRSAASPPLPYPSEGPAADLKRGGPFRP